MSLHPVKTIQKQSAARHNSVWETLREPFGEIEPFVRRLRSGHGWRPLAEHEETKDAFLVRIELPGVPQEKVHVEVDGYELNVSGEVEEDDRSGAILSHRVGRFQHRTTLPSSATPEQIVAYMVDGVLTVTVPKDGDGHRRTVPISSAPEPVERFENPAY